MTNAENNASCLQKDMTLRDWFAAQAMNAIIQGVAMAGDQASVETFARIAFKVADGMMEERTKGSPE